MKEVQVTGLESNGVSLVSPLAAEFNAKADALSAPGFADVVKEAKPYVVMIANKTSRTIVAFTISSNVPSGFSFEEFSWIGSEHEPTPEHVENQIFMAPNDVGATGVDFGDRSTRGILPGEERLVGLGFEIPTVKLTFEQLPPEWEDDRVWNWGISTTREMVERIKGLAAGIEVIKIKLDTVVFDDGLLIGQDAEGRLQRTLEGNVKVRQDLYREIVDRLNLGASVEETFPLKPAEPPDVWSPEDFVGMFRPEAIGTVNTLRKKYGNDRIREVLLQAILKEPFVVHREG